MPYRTIPGTNSAYFLIAVDESGVERTGDPDSPDRPISDKLIDALRHEHFTDVFFWSHGWKGDVTGAFDQYDRWIGAFAARADDAAEMAARRPGYRAAHVGFHWPSQAWGNEELIAGNSFAPGAGAQLAALIESYAVLLGDSPPVRAALTKLFDELRTHAGASELTQTMVQAYRDLNDALELGSDGPAGDGSADRPAFDPHQVLSVSDNAAFGIGELGQRLLAPLRQLTFWTMKKRAKTVGEEGLHPLLANIQRAAPAVRIHLIGHSFGCIVMSSAIAGKGVAPLPRPIDSCVLLQGATSLWAFSTANPFQGNVAGYFSRIVGDRLVAGPLVTTQSRHDYALGKIYPWAAGLSNQVSFNPPGAAPQFGAIGTHGICGLSDTRSQSMNDLSTPYQLEPGVIYNVDASHYVCKLDGASGAHSDIDGPEVAHLIWQAALPGKSAA